MTVDDIEALFDEFEDDSHRFELIPPERRRSTRPDLHAFLLLDALVPRDRDMVASAEHDQIWLDVEPEELAAVASEDDILELVRCGVFIDSEIDRLSMFA